MAGSVLRTARCACGACAAETRGEPEAVAICHCGACRRRTGSAFSWNAWWPETAVRATGALTARRRVSERGRWWEDRFCPGCGATLVFVAEFLPGRIGVSAGCFADPGFPAPTIAVWDAGRPSWLDDAAALPRHPTQRG